MKIDILTLFPEMFEGPFSESIIKRAQEKELVEINVHNLRKWAEDKHNTVDDRPYGGGPGMVMRVDVIDKAVEDLKSQITNHKSQTNSKSQTPNSKNRSLITDHRSQVILLSAKGETYTQRKAKELSKKDHIILIAGHYEGVDHRVHKHIADEVISIGDYVLTGGEIPTMVITDSVVRLIPGVIDPESLKSESFSAMENLPAGRQGGKWKMQNRVEHPHYTRPEEYKGWKVPDILLSGNHAEIEKWREENSKKARRRE